MKKILHIGLLTLMLTGCNFSFEFDSDFLNSVIDSGINSITQVGEIYGNAKEEGVKGTEYLDYYSNMTNCRFVPSLGEQKMLVVPVLFEDDNLENLKYDSDKIIEDINIAFNGTNEEIGWESVNSYYYKSSYGQLDLKSTVYNEWIRIDKTFKEVSKLSTSTYYDPTWYVVDYVVNELKNKIDLKEYDNNSDGYIDGIWLIYGRDNYTNLSFPSLEEQDILWAYAFWEYNNVGSLANPKANVYGWGSYDFMYVSDNSKLQIDAHTFIHETGHMLGLDDYYDYDDETNRSGCLDMMDHNIGDHNAYSKFLLGWVTPKVYNFEKEKFTIKPFESSGDFILIPASKDRSISTMEEYLLIEFYTPTGLNEHDALYSYLNKYPKMFTNIGIKIYHIDSRIGQLTYNEGDWLYTNYAYKFTLDDLYDYSSKISYFTIYSSNTGSVSYNSNYKLLSLISSKYGVGHDYQEYARNIDLYGVGSKLIEFKFNDGNTVNLNLIVNEMNENRASITIG